MNNLSSIKSFQYLSNMFPFTAARCAAVAVMSSVKVAVRVRPFNAREVGRECEGIIEMDGNTTREWDRGV